MQHVSWLQPFIVRFQIQLATSIHFLILTILKTQIQPTCKVAGKVAVRPRLDKDIQRLKVKTCAELTA